MDATQVEAKRIERVVLACVQCRNRHVKCDATQPVCNRCKRDGKECKYQKSRRGGLDKAALARRKQRLQEEAELIERNQLQGDEENRIDVTQNTLTMLSTVNEQFQVNNTIESAGGDEINFSFSTTNSLTFQLNTDRLLDLFFENFWPSFPIVLPLHHLQQRRISNDHGIPELMHVLQWIGSIYAPWTASESYYERALQALNSPVLPHSPFNVQALMLFAIAQYHCALKEEGMKMVNLAVTIAIELGMNQKGFAQAHGESNPVLEESWRRTYYMLNIVDQHFAIVSNSPIYTLAHVPNHVDLPCDDEYYEIGQIPPVSTWKDFQDREFAEIEIVYSSIVYLYDIAKDVSHVMDMFLETGTFSDAMIERCDTRMAIWLSLLPASKKDPLLKDGRVDEIMFSAHMIYAITINSMHRPFSSLALVDGEMATRSFLCSIPFVHPPQQGRGAHTARALRVIDLSTKLQAIPCAVERHSLFTMCISARLATAQISACKNLLDDRALSIARDRVRLSIGYLNTMGSFWPLGKMMAKEVRSIARLHLSNIQSTVAMQPNSEVDPRLEIDLPRDELIWPVNPSAQIDIYSGIVLPVWDPEELGIPSSNIPNIP